ncbi:hypothetical protein PTNB85_03944 [Pyrenophora teres f. teres]|uniref:Uncharacterized protein n=1 Tax=Pyrenophora teres f. teres TaxID=97479 RepID=A0A6S6W0Y7_9PLEO|nr:hypothetical protein HRS9139_05504 [Pyrenophora teres f. teres]KAE8840545.1 hypothetical protein PTNB85_03944 [Pyrenophora teres f. teres]KAE8864042.1 hypothetical protein PTNB29_04006 [Pyrenophora teres f. teres]CAE7033043.1 hypothetical protein PTTW11_05127 [Pyrenophora teres f. teres]
MSCNRCSSHDTSTSRADGIGVSQAIKEVITGNIQYLRKTFQDCGGNVPDPSLYLNKLVETVEVVETAFVQVAPCDEVLLQLLEFLRAEFPRHAAPAETGPAAAPCCGRPPIVDREQPPSVRFTVEQDDWEQINKHDNAKIKTMLGELGPPWSEIAQVSKHRLRHFNILEVYFENEEKRKAMLKTAEKANELQALKSRLQLYSDVTVHQDIYEVKVFDVRFGRKMNAQDLKSRLSSWSKENLVTIERAHYANNELRLELTNRDQAIQLVDQQFIVLDGKKYTDVRDWDRRWDRFQCYWCLGENHSAEWCRGRGAKPNCLWCAKTHPSKDCPDWGIASRKNCIYCGKNHCGTDNKCKHPTVVAELEKRGKMQARGTRWYRNRRVTDQEGFTVVGGRRRGQASAAAGVGTGAGAGATAKQPATTEASAMDATAKPQDPFRQQTMHQYTVLKPPHNRRAGTASSPRRSRTPGSEPSTSRQPPAANKDGNATATMPTREEFAQAVKNNSMARETALNAIESRLPPSTTESCPNGSPGKKRKFDKYRSGGGAASSLLSPPPLVGFGPQVSDVAAGAGDSQGPSVINAHFEATPRFVSPSSVTMQLPSPGNLPRQSRFKNIFNSSQCDSQQNPQQSSKMKPDLPEQFARDNPRTRPLVTLQADTANTWSPSFVSPAPALSPHAPHAYQPDKSRQPVTSVTPQTSQLPTSMEPTVLSAETVFVPHPMSFSPTALLEYIEYYKAKMLSNGWTELQVNEVLHSQMKRGPQSQEPEDAKDTEMPDGLDCYPGVGTAMSDHGSEDNEPLRGDHEDDSEADFEDTLLNPNDSESRHLDHGFDYDASNDDSATHQLNPTLASQ